MECEARQRLKEKHSYLDFLYFKLLTAVPFGLVLIGFWYTRPVMILPYLLWIGIHITLVYRILCTHCPHYGAYNGKTECLYLWAVPAFYQARPGPQSFFEKVGVQLLLAISTLFPVPWLIRNPELLVVYLLSIAVLLITMMRYECVRCVHTDCAHNRVGK